MAQSSSNLTEEEKKKIQDALKANQEKEKQDMLNFQMQNAILDAQRRQPGKKYC